MKKPARRDQKLSRPLVPLDRSVLERVTAGLKTLDPIAAGYRMSQPDSDDRGR
jgi:hypothetical protein